MPRAIRVDPSKPPYVELYDNFDEKNPVTPAQVQAMPPQERWNWYFTSPRVKTCSGDRWQVDWKPGICTILGRVKQKLTARKDEAPTIEDAYRRLLDDADKLYQSQFKAITAVDLDQLNFEGKLDDALHQYLKNNLGR